MLHETIDLFQKYRQVAKKLNISVIHTSFLLEKAYDWQRT